MQFDRLIKLINEENYKKIKDLKITIIGLGGVGSYVFEALIRSGVENITIIDKDTINITNLNRQLMTNLNNIDEEKVEVLRKRALSINKNVKINAIKAFLSEENISLIESNNDYVIDCCDTISTKKTIIKECLEKNIKSITCLGMGKRLDPSKLTMCDLRKTYNDPLAKILRKWANDNNIKKNITCCFSKELPIATNTKDIASAIFVPASAGLLIASYIIKDALK